MERVHYRFAEPGDREKVIELLTDVFSNQQKSDRQRSSDSWKWKHEENVFDETVTIVADLNGRIIGTGTLWPFHFDLGGTSHLSYQTCSLAVAEDYRGHGVFRNINRVRLETAIERNASFLFSFPNRNSLPGYEKMGWTLLGKIPWFVKPLRPVNILRDKLSDSKVSTPFTPDSDDQLKGRDIVFEHPLRMADEIVLHKSAKFFEWRYANHRSFSYGFVEHRKTGTHTFGAAYSIQQKGDFREMVIIDIISETPEMTLEIIKKAEGVARRYGVMFLAMMAPYGLSKKRMLLSGYLPVPLKNFTVCTLHSDLKNRVENMANWSLFAGLHDSI